MADPYNAGIGGPADRAMQRRRDAAAKNEIRAAGEIRKKDAEIARLREALEWIMQLAWEGCDVDGGDLQDLMTRLELLVEVPADDEHRAEYDADTMFVLAWSEEALKGENDGS